MSHHMDRQNTVTLTYRNSWERSGSKPSSSPLHEEPSVIQTPTSDHILHHCRLQAVLKQMKNGNRLFHIVWNSFFMYNQLPLLFEVLFQIEKATFKEIKK